MTGLGVGVDLMAVADVAEAIAEFGDRYLRRVYTDSELADCSGPPATEAAGLAARFAAKEATVKALQPGDTSIGWRDVEIRREAGGAPRLHLHGAASELAQARGVSNLAVSITHQGPLAAAVVVAL